MFDLWNSEATLARVATYVSYAFLLLGFIVAAGGLYLKSRIDNRVYDLRERAAAERKNTPPALSVALGHDSTGELLLEIQFENDIPIEANWHVHTRENELVTGWQTHPQEVVPTDDRMRFRYRVSINNQKVKDRFIELVFRYQSGYAADLNNPPELQGKIYKQYRYVPGRLQHWDDSH